MIKRDQFGFICQHSKDDPNYLDGGDSVSRSSLMALFFPGVDSSLLPKFEYGGVMVRHPIQSPWNNHKNCTRDQLIPYLAACWKINRYDIVRRLFWSHFKRLFFCQNTEKDFPGTVKKFPEMPDILSPSHILHFILCGKIRILYFLVPFLYPFHYLDLAWNCFIQPEKEQNQFFCMSIVAGTSFTYLKCYGLQRFTDSMNSYWRDSFRDQEEIGDSLIALAHSEFYKGLCLRR